MADLGSITILTPNPGILTLTDASYATVQSLPLSYGQIAVVSDPMADKTFPIANFGIAGTGADAGTNNSVTATTGQLYPLVIG